jgi:hypothetical protein
MCAGPVARGGPRGAPGRPTPGGSGSPASGCSRPSWSLALVPPGGKCAGPNLPAVASAAPPVSVPASSPTRPSSSLRRATTSPPVPPRSPPPREFGADRCAGPSPWGTAGAPQASPRGRAPGLALLVPCPRSSVLRMPCKGSITVPDSGRGAAWPSVSRPVRAGGAAKARAGLT